MIKIYHNNRCSKSRQGLAILEASGKPFEIINYLEHPPTKKELQAIILLLGIEPMDLVRTNEAIWKKDFKHKSLEDSEIIDAMVNNPKLIERPIVINEDQAVIGRPPENIQRIL
ncbi:arsenate reductase (glutaredoxin) [Changchengzhania lutea]|uniref:arsenate reductase (glutaredoxin) n=1 Tax=Changchengzhania lutea TaxID=2049305 RepID=UPI00115E40A7|nr:arsenate reductase (glutaredoxin) [Changchengzhania lutea]